MLLFLLRVIQQIFGLGAIYYIVRTLDQDMFGNYQFVLSVISVLVIFTLPGIGNAIMQSVSRGFYGTFRKGQKLAFYSSFISVMLLLVFSGVALYVSKLDLSIGFLIAAFFFPFSRGICYWRSVKTGEEKFSSIVLYEGFASIVTSLLLIAGVLSYPGQLFVPVVAVFLVPSIQNIILTYSSYRASRYSVDAEAGSIDYGVRTTVFISLNVIANQIDKLLLFTLLSPTSLALFYSAERISELVKSVIQDVAAVLAPRFSKQKTYSLSIDSILIVFSVVVGVIIVVCAFTVIPQIILLLFGEEYRESIPYAQLLLCSVAIGNLATLRYRFILSRLDAKNSNNVNVVMSLTRIAASVILVPIYGLWGAVMSTFIYRVVMVFYVHLIMKRSYLKPNDKDNQPLVG